MGNKKVTVVYQDCPLCGDRGKALKKIVAAKGVRLHKVSFASDEGRQLINLAVFQHKITTLPFYTDGIVFAQSIEELLEKTSKKSKVNKKARK